MSIDWSKRLWLWAHPAGSHTSSPDLFGLSGSSSIHPAEAANYLRIRNLMMVRFAGLPQPPYDAAAADLADLDSVLWSVVGDASTVDGDDEAERVGDLAARYANISGAIMDDFFERPDADGQRQIAGHAPDEIDRIKACLSERAGRPMSLWVVVYGHQLELDIGSHLARCDGVTFWSWTADELAQTRDRLTQLRRLAPGIPIRLGCYLYDYGGKREMSVDAMKAQCDEAEALIQEGVVEGLIFLASCICDLPLPAVTSARDWIAERV